MTCSARAARLCPFPSSTRPYSGSGVPPSTASSIIVDQCARRSSSNCQWRLWLSSRKCMRLSRSSWLPMCVSRGVISGCSAASSVATRKDHLAPLTSSFIWSARQSVSLRASFATLAPPPFIFLPVAAAAGGGALLTFSITSGSRSGKKSPSKSGKSRTDVRCSTCRCRLSTSLTKPSSCARLSIFSYQRRSTSALIGGRPSDGRQWKMYSVNCSSGGATQMCACSKPRAAAC
mmetsp:Transcript_3568/g.9526  ORF Transcript_3568/g.9526 Transcript_3568/m.9526 type:complete len:233 (-) Transcript_3568:141-839(-)